MYLIKIEEKAEKFLKKIPLQDSKIILNKLYSLRENPFRYLKRLRGSKLWRLRILKYRTIIDVVVSKNKIIVVKVDYRKRVYH